MNDAARLDAKSACVWCDAPCRWVLCEFCYRLSALLPEPEPEQPVRYPERPRSEFGLPVSVDGVHRFGF